MKKWCLPVLALLLVFMGTVVFAAPLDPAPAGPPAPSSGFRQFEPGDVHRGPGSGFGAWRGIVSYLGLSQEQVTRMRELRSRLRTETHDLRYDLAVKRLEMRKLFTDPKVDDATLLAKQKEVSSLRQKLMDKRAQMMIESRKILTPEQIQKLDRMPMGHGMGRGMGDGGRWGLGN
jgi:Spy/CpxP family protein refolding chaperone